jgi:hypothetical protein
MIHLPKRRTRAKVWPDPKRQVPAQPPDPKSEFIPMLPATGMTVEWDEFRHRQYLAGDIHLFDPKTGKGEPYEHDHPHHEHNLEVAATWAGEHGDRARERLHESLDGVYTEVICVGAVAVPSVLPDRFNPHAGTFQGKYEDPSQLPFPRSNTFAESNAMTQQFADDRARWKFERGQFDSWVGEYTVFGHVLGGTFLAADTMVAVDDTINGIRENLYVAGRRFQRSKSGGTITILELRKPNFLRA